MASLPGRNIVNSPILLAFTWILLIPQVTGQNACGVFPLPTPSARLECGFRRISSSSCLDASDCCFNDDTNAKYCFYPRGSMCGVDQNSRQAYPNPGGTKTSCESGTNGSPRGCWNTAPGNSAPDCFRPINICAFDDINDRSVTSENTAAACADNNRCWDGNGGECFETTGNIAGSGSVNPNNYCVVPQGGSTTECRRGNGNDRIDRQDECADEDCCWYLDDGARGYHCYQQNDQCRYQAQASRTPCGGINPTIASCTAAGCCWDNPECFEPLPENSCTIAVADRMECGYRRISRANCLGNTECCFNPTQSGVKHCFYHRDSECDANPNDRIECLPPSNANSLRTACLNKGCCYNMIDDNNNAICFYREYDICNVPVAERISVATSACTAMGYCSSDTSPTCYEPIEICSVPNGSRQRCGPPGMMSQDDCNRRGCCWDRNLSGGTRCYLPTGSSPKACPVEIGDRVRCGSTAISTMSQCVTFDDTCCWFPNQFGAPSCFSQEERCNIDPSNRQMCGASGNDQGQCDALACCYYPSLLTASHVCYYGTDQTSTTSPTTTTTTTTTTPVVDGVAIGPSFGPSGGIVGPFCEVYPPAPGRMRLLQTDVEEDAPTLVQGTELDVNDTGRVDYPLDSFPDTDPGDNNAYQCCFMPENGDPFIYSDLRRLTTLIFKPSLPIQIPEGGSKTVTYILEVAPELACRDVPGFDLTRPLKKAIVQFHKPLNDATRTCGGGLVKVPPALLLHGNEDCAMIIYGNQIEAKVRSQVEIVSVENNIVTGDSVVRFRIWITLVDYDGTECRLNGGYLTVEIEDRSVHNSACSVVKGTLWRTFSGTYLYSGLVGVFKMHQSGHLPFMLYVRTQADKDNVVTGPCAAICQAGDDLIEVNACGPGNGRPGGYAPAVVRSTITGSLTYGFKFFTDHDGNRAFYQCYFPDGGHAKIYTGPFSVWYLPSSYDDNAKGVCGDVTDYIDITSVTGQAANNLINDARLNKLIFPLSSDQLNKLSHYITYRDFCFCAYYRGICCSGSPYLVCLGANENQWDEDKLDRLRDVDLTSYEYYGDKTAIATNGYASGTGGTGQYYCETIINDVVDACDDLNSYGFPTSAELAVTISACKTIISISGSDRAGDCIADGLAKRCLSVVAQSNSSPPTVIPIALCPGRCNNRGTCIWPGYCDCDRDAFGPTCSSDGQDGPVLVAIVSGNTCNPENEPCNMVDISGIFNPDLQYYCVINKIKISESGSQTVGTMEQPAGVISATQIKCPVPSSAYISVRDSNGRESNSLLYLVFDPRCWSCTIDPLRCTRQRDGCLIHYECMGRGSDFGGYYEYDQTSYVERSPKGVKCYYCDPSRNPDGWSVKKDKKCEDRKRPDGGDDDDDNPPRWRFIVLIAASVALVIAIVIIIVCLIFRCCHCCRGYHSYHDDASSSHESSTYGIVNTGVEQRFNTLGVYASRPYWK